VEWRWEQTGAGHAKNWTSSCCQQRRTQRTEVTVWSAGCECSDDRWMIGQRRWTDRDGLNLLCVTCNRACSEIRSRVLRSATVPFFYDKKNGTVALRSTSKHSGAYFRTRPWWRPVYGVLVSCSEFCSFVSVTIVISILARLNRESCLCTRRYRIGQHHQNT